MKAPVGPVNVTLGIGYAVPRPGLPAARSFKNWIEAALVGAGVRKAAALGIRLVGTREGRQMNLRYRGQDHATNVLSFTADRQLASSHGLLGDLVLCVPVVVREAREQHKPVRAHFAHLTVHGTLHLLGLDHQRDSDANRMEALEIKVLAALGIANPYL